MSRSTWVILIIAALFSGLMAGTALAVYDPETRESYPDEPVRVLEDLTGGHGTGVLVGRDGERECRLEVGARGRNRYKLSLHHMDPERYGDAPVATWGFVLTGGQIDARPRRVTLTTQRNEESRGLWHRFGEEMEWQFELDREGRIERLRIARTQGVPLTRTLKRVDFAPRRKNLFRRLFRL